MIATQLRTRFDSVAGSRHGRCTTDAETALALLLRDAIDVAPAIDGLGARVLLHRWSKRAGLQVAPRNLGRIADGALRAARVAA
jgi:hypothetical protein